MRCFRKEIEDLKIEIFKAKNSFENSMFLEYDTQCDCIQKSIETLGFTTHNLNRVVKYANRGTAMTSIRVAGKEYSDSREGQEMLNEFGGSIRIAGVYVFVKANTLENFDF